MPRPAGASGARTLAAHAPGALVALQRAAGNRAVSSLVQSGQPVQHVGGRADADSTAMTVGGRRQAGNAAVGVLVARQQPGTAVADRPAADPRRRAFPWSGTVAVSWSAALRSAPRKDREDPHATTIADLAPGTTVWVTGQERGWLHVEVDVDGKLARGYVSQELITWVRSGEVVIDPAVADKVLDPADQIGVERAFVILKQAETAKAADPGYRPDAAAKGRIDTAIWVLDGSGRWTVDPTSYRVTLTPQRGTRIRLQSIEDFILFVEAVERQYPSATPQAVASEIRQMWFNSEAWRAMLDSRGIRDAGKDVDIETRPNPIAEIFDMTDLAPTSGRKLFDTRMGTVDISHVMTGIDGALSSSPTGNDLKARVLRKANKSDPRDFVTWAGDLGQAYAQYLVRRWAKGDTRANLQAFVDAEAGPEALLGDIHGYIATQVWRDMQGIADPIGGPLKVSSILRTMYLVDKPKPGGRAVTTRAYLERVSGRKASELRDHVVERALAFGPFEYAKEVSAEWTTLGKVWEGVTSGGEEGALEDLMAKFGEHHRRNEADAADADKLGGLVDTFMKMLERDLR